MVLLLAITSALAAPLSRAEAQRSLRALDARFSRALREDDLAAYRGARADTDAYTARLKTIVGGPASSHALVPCWRASIYLTTWRTEQWIAAHSGKMTPADEQTVVSQWTEYSKFLDECR